MRPRNQGLRGGRTEVRTSDPLAALRALTRDRIAHQTQVEGKTLEAATTDALGFAATLTTHMDSGFWEFVEWVPRVADRPGKPQVVQEGRDTQLRMV